MKRNIGTCSLALVISLAVVSSAALLACGNAAPAAADAGVLGTGLLGSGMTGVPTGAPAPILSGGILGAATDGGVAPVGSPFTGAPGVPGMPVPVTPGATVACSPDTHTTVRFQNRLLDIVTSNGRLFTFEANGAPWASNGTSLGSITYYASGPCAGQQICRFDTHAFGRIDGRLYEFITAGGRNWIFDENGATVDGGSRIATMDRYFDACSGMADCHFDTRAFLDVDGGLVEAVTVGGRLYQYWRDGSRLASNGVDLTALPHYAMGPCAGRAAGTCRLDSQTFGVYEGQLVEVVTAAGNIWRWFANDAEPQRTVGPASPISTQSPFNRGACN